MISDACRIRREPSLSIAVQRVLKAPCHLQMARGFGFRRARCWEQQRSSQAVPGQGIALSSLERFSFRQNHLNDKKPHKTNTLSVFLSIGLVQSDLDMREQRQWARYDNAQRGHAAGAPISNGPGNGLNRQVARSSQIAKIETGWKMAKIRRFVPVRPASICALRVRHGGSANSYRIVANGLGKF